MIARIAPILLTGLLSLSASSLAMAQPPAPARLTVMTYNVENFFDANDDPRMPNGSSNEVINTPAWVDAKAAAVARVIQRFDFGQGPDVLVLTEVESQASLDAIKDQLKDKGAAYKTAILIDADPNRPAPKPDQRGIKVAILSKLSLAAGVKPQTFPVDLTKSANCKSRDGSPGTTRDLLQVDLTLPDGKILTVFGGHLPSGGNPRACREIAAQTIANIAAKLPASHVVVAAGDFNFNCAPQERQGLATAFKGWVLPSQLDNACRGSGSQFYWREKTWSYLDVITQKATGASEAWAIEPKTFRTVLTDEEQLQWDERDQVMRPKAFRFNAETGKGSGTADHWPIAIDLVQANR
ncbi:endonuclease/exonuclease/phosphatase family protein [Asticcacaulis sp. AND118]|uniref:endonuclease/exonuclease/phosphatase family protein n=1 Tax=Asticcacaulis sp. AND118 TaxID=2840468 RepID=UPI001CFFAD9C|nr:endonuclease/exonuclease/phosphatase family protein [Asticcacaulis sp. AND118]UDF04059.1 endonuclease/exonuclease/phosphatase family protein [Asticcacaulis sp. AND118]